VVFDKFKDVSAGSCGTVVLDKWNSYIDW